MEQKWIDQFNKKCAEFLGYELITPDKRRHPDEWEYSYWEHKDKANVHTSKKVLGRDGYLSFHSDWNWIMEVVDRIENTKTTDLSNAEPFVTIRLVGCDIKFYNKERLPIVTNAKTKKEAVVKAIDQFIDWFNIQQIS